MNTLVGLPLWSDLYDNKERGAIISDDGAFRYALWRVWEPKGRPFVVVGLNPSTADAFEDDPTIRRCVGFAKREGCGRLVMLNLFAFRSTDPKVLRFNTAAKIGPRNDDALRWFCGQAKTPIVAAWGQTWHTVRAAQVTKMLLDDGNHLMCLGKAKGGQPRHPLYLKADSPVVPL